jgi:protease-4
MKRRSVLFGIVIFICALSGCVSPRVGFMVGETVPLKEYTLQGTSKEKVLLIPVKGFISDEREEGFLRSEPSMVQEIVSQLRKAENDRRVKAVVLKVDSPGGTVTASDVLYHEILSFKERTGAAIVVSMMNVAASGGYYISLPSDYIVAHPTTITGSVGVVFVQPKFTGLMEKIGVDVDVSKSGEKKDMGSPFRDASEEEKKIMQNLTDSLGKRFVDLVSEHRDVTVAQLEDIASARIYLADEALKFGLIDEIGYIEDALQETKKRAKLPPSAKVVVYRRVKYPDDNIYNTATSNLMGREFSVVNIDLPGSPAHLQPGFYYLWLPQQGVQ